LTATATAISAGKDAQLLAGRDLSLAAVGHTVHTEGPHYDHADTTTNTVSSVTAAGNLTVVAGRDLASQGAQLGAGNVLVAGAGRDLTLDTVTDVASSLTHAAEGHTAVSESHRDETLQGSTLSGANGVVVSAGRDLTATAATIGSALGAVALGAGHDLTLDAGQENHTASRDTTRTHSGLLSSSTTTTHDASSDTYAVGTAISGSNITLSAGHDLTTQGAQVSATQDIGLSAGHDVLLGAAQDSHSEEHDRSTTKRGGGLGVLVGTSKGDLFTRTHKVQQDSSSDNVAVGSVLSGDHVTVAAAHDLTTQAAQIAGTHDVVLAAGHDLTVGTADNTHTEDHSLAVNTYGAQRSGLHGMFGIAKSAQTASETDTTATGSLIGSTDGAVTLSAGQDVHITGSDVLSQVGTAIVGQNITIDAAVGTADSHQTQSLHTGGIMAGLTGGAATAAEQAYASGQRAGQVSDKRLKALYAAQAAYGARDAYKGGSAGVGGAGSGGGAQGAANSSGVSLRIGIGASSTSAHSDTHDDLSYASHIRSNGDVTIAATNGDLNVIGSQVSGDNVALAASHDLNLLSQAEQHTQSDHSANARGELGISIGSQTGFYATADGGKGLSHGNGTSYATSSVTASDTLSLISGNDTAIEGAQTRGNTVLADIGGNLSLASQQTTDDYASHSWQAGGTYVYGSGSEVHASAGMVDSNYMSVQQVSGIGAGSGGFQVQVSGHTDLKGAVIASTADPSLNLLDTGTLSFSDLKNSASYSTMSAGISVGSGSGGTSASPSIGVPQFGDKSSTTQAGIAQGTIITRDNPSIDLNGLDRTPDIDAAGLKPIFDQQKVAEQQELGNVAGQVGMRAAGDIASYKQTQAAADLTEARDAGDTAAEADAQQRLDRWSEGGSDKIILHGLFGAAAAALGGGNALQGALGAGSSQAASGAMERYLRDQGIDPYSPEGKTYTQLASAAIGGATGGGAGASTALTGDAFNRQLHPNEIKLITGELAAKYAAEHPGISERDAETILIKQSLRQVDDAWSAKLGPDDNDAKQWLANNTPDWAKQNGYFSATSAERVDSTINGQYYDGEFHTQWNGILNDLVPSVVTGFIGSEETPAQHGSQVNFSGYEDMANTLRDQGTMESLERKVVSGQGLTIDEVHTYAQLATLYPMFRAGALGPYGQLGVAIRDQDGTAAAMAIIGAVPGEGLAANAGKATGATVDTIRANVLSNIAETKAGNIASGFGKYVDVEQQAVLASIKVETPYGSASQSLDSLAVSARQQVQDGAILYRIGTTGRSQGAEAQFWALEDPRTPGFADRYGIPAENVQNIDFIEAATIKPGSNFVTRPAPSVGSNVGGGIEVVVPENGVNMKWFSGKGK
ncbi:hypothetical protein HFP05_01930, partial [Rhodanobacter denitrificans]|nr:hypothetical protein [Rhodanobacter denitrificans]